MYANAVTLVQTCDKSEIDAGNIVTNLEKK